LCHHISAGVYQSLGGNIPICNKELNPISVFLMEKKAQTLWFYGAKYYDWDILGYAPV
jgi:hypothetical protein